MKKLPFIYGRKKDPDQDNSVLEQSLKTIREKKESELRMKQLYQQMQLLKEESDRYRRRVRELESEKAELQARLRRTQS